MLRTRSATLLAALVVLAACQDETIAPPPAAPPASSDLLRAEGYPTAGEARTGWVLGPTGSPVQVTYRVQGEWAVWEGDIILGRAASVARTAEELAAARQGGARRGVVINTAGSRWPGGVIPYVIDASLPSQTRVTDAIANIEAATDIVDFVPRTTQADYVRIAPGGGCGSDVGRKGGQQTIELASTCTTGNAMHELLHTTGMYHEHTRCDRDSFVTINSGNIQSGYASQFTKQCTGALDVFAYDEGSIMHYPADAFSSNGFNTITSLRGREWMMGQRSGLSAIDVSTVDWMYPRPYSAGISGKQYVALHESAPYTASVTGGTAPFTYEWRTRQSGPSTSGTWSGWFSTGSSNVTYASINSCGLNTNYLEVRVTDSTARQTTASYTMYITNPC